MYPQEFPRDSWGMYRELGCLEDKNSKNCYWFQKRLSEADFRSKANGTESKWAKPMIQLNLFLFCLDRWLCLCWCDILPRLSGLETRRRIVGNTVTSKSTNIAYMYEDLCIYGVYRVYVYIYIEPTLLRTIWYIYTVYNNTMWELQLLPKTSLPIVHSFSINALILRFLAATKDKRW